MRRGGLTAGGSGGWGSKTAEDLFKIAINLAGFDKYELMREIHRRQRGREALVNSATVENAMQVISDRHAHLPAPDLDKAGWEITEKVKAWKAKQVSP